MPSDGSKTLIRKSENNKHLPLKLLKLNKKNNDLKILIDLQYQYLMILVVNSTLVGFL